MLPIEKTKKPSKKATEAIKEGLLPGEDILTGVIDLDELPEDTMQRFFLSPGEAIDIITSLPNHLSAPTMDVWMLSIEEKNPWMQAMVMKWLRLQVSVNAEARNRFEKIMVAREAATRQIIAQQGRPPNSGPAIE